MANIELRERFFGNGLVGNVAFNPGDSAHLRQAFVDAAERTAREVAGVHSELVALGWNVRELGNAVWSLQQELSTRLDVQTGYLAGQLVALESIDAALRSPAKIVAAEQLVQAGELLRTNRCQRALACAQQAIESDPTHPGGFVAAGWAYVGLGDMTAASEAFVEAISAAKSDVERAEYARLAGRSLIVCGDQRRAQNVLDEALSDRLPPNVSALLHYDLTLALVEANDESAASSHLETAVRLDRRLAAVAAAEPLFQGHELIVKRALSIAADEVRRLDEQIALSRDQLRQALGGMQAILDADEDNAQALGLIDTWDDLDERYTELLGEEQRFQLDPDQRDAQVVSLADLVNRSQDHLSRVRRWSNRLHALLDAVTEVCRANDATLAAASDWQVEVVRARLLRDETWLIEAKEDGNVTVERR